EAASAAIEPCVQEQNAFELKKSTVQQDNDQITNSIEDNVIETVKANSEVNCDDVQKQLQQQQPFKDDEVERKEDEELDFEECEQHPSIDQPDNTEQEATAGVQKSEDELASSDLTASKNENKQLDVEKKEDDEDGEVNSEDDL